MLLQRLAWRGDTCETCEGATGEDLSGGYFEAGGSYLKFSYPLAFTITQLAWGVVEYRDGYAKVLHIVSLPSPRSQGPCCEREKQHSHACPCGTLGARRLRRLAIPGLKDRRTG